MNNNHNNVFYLKNHKVYNTLCPANSYNANLGKKVQIKGVIKLHKKERKENKYNNTQKEKPHANSSTGVLLLEKKTKITTEGIYNVSG